jgi:hypothetical protein
MFFTCEKCLKIFNHKGDYIKHINMKKNCSELDKKYKCSGCDKGFTNVNNMKFHQKNNCEKLKTISEANEYAEKIKDLLKNANNKNIENDIKKIINNIGTQINQNNYMNTTNNTINQNTNINFNLNPYGKEKLVIPDEIYQKGIKNLINGICKLIEYIHYNIDHPENQNIKLNSLSSKYIEYFNGIDWMTALKDSMVHNLITDKKNMIDEYFDDKMEKGKISEKVAKKYEEQTEKLDEVLCEEFRKIEASKENKDSLKKLYETINLIMWNKRKELEKEKESIELTNQNSIKLIKN